jgi:hypothetical protein
LVSGSGGFSSLQSVNSTVSTKNTVPVFSMEPGTSWPIQILKCDQATDLDPGSCFSGTVHILI